MFKLEFYKQAAKYYKKVDTKVQKRINKAIEEIIKDPSEGIHIKKLKGRLEGKYRYDIDRLRIIYYIDEDNEIIYVEAIGPRGDVYR